MSVTSLLQYYMLTAFYIEYDLFQLAHNLFLFILPEYIFVYFLSRYNVIELHKYNYIFRTYHLEQFPGNQ